MELPKRKVNRLTQYDYRTENAYFITICTANKENLFWRWENKAITCPEDVPLTSWGKQVEQVVLEIPAHYPGVLLDHYVIMPNHIHLLLRLQGDNPPSVSTIVQQMKGRVSKTVGGAVWQKGFYDHVVRGDQDYQDIWNYIEGNPGKWTEDRP